MTDEQIELGLRRLLAADSREARDCSSALYRYCSGEATLEEAALLKAHLATCAECRADLTVFQGLADQPRAAPARGVWLRWLAAPLAAGLLVVLGWQLWPRRLLEPGERGARRTASLRVKGGYQLQTAVRRGTAQFVARSGDAFHTGDALGLFYSAPRPAYAGLLFSDQAGRVTRLTPSPVRVQPGAELPLPDGALLEEGSGCEWIVAFFSEEKPPDLAAAYDSGWDEAMVKRFCDLVVQQPKLARRLELLVTHAALIDRTLGYDQQANRYDRLDGWTVFDDQNPVRGVLGGSGRRDVVARQFNTPFPT